MTRAELMYHNKDSGITTTIRCEWPLRIDNALNPIIHEIRKDLMGAKWQLYDALTGSTLS